MSVHDDENTGAQENRAQAQAPQQERVERPRDTRDERSVRRGGSLKDLNRLIGTPLPRNSGGESLVRAINAFKQVMSADKNVGGSGAIDLSKLVILGMEATEHNVQVSSVIFTYAHESEGQLNVYSFVAALEGSFDGELPTRNVNISRRDYSVPTVVGDYITDGYLKTAADIVSKHYSDNRRSVNVIDAGWRTISTNTDFSIEANPLVRQIAFYVAASMVAMVNEAEADEVFFDLDWLAKGENLDISIDLSGRELFTADGLPRRSDLVVSIHGSIQNDETVIRNKLTTVGGNINLVYAPEVEDRGLSNRRSRDEVTQIYTPVMVINNLDTGANAITPELLLLGLAGASVISRKANWAQVFLPNDVQKGKTDYRDTGALAYLSKLRQHVDVGNRTNLDTDEWADYFFSLVREDLAWAIEVEEGGDNSWITSLMYAAATGNPDAEDRLWDYADRLTMGHFSSRAKAAGVNEFVTLSGSRYLTGTYIDEHGDMKDLRDFDLLRWLVQTGEQDPETALDWQETFDNIDKELEVRTSEQNAMLTSVLSNNVQYSRYVNLLYINPLAIRALADAVTACGVGIDQGQAMYSFGQRRLRGNNRIQGFAAGDVSGGVFTRARDTGGVRGSRRSPVGNGLGRRNY